MGTPYTDAHTVILTETHTQRHTQVINQTVNSTNLPFLPLRHTRRHTHMEATVGSEWWALRATGQGPHEKPLCLGGMEQRGQQVHQPNEGWPQAHTHIHTHGRGLEGVVQTQSAIDKRMMIHTCTGTNKGTYSTQSSIMALSVRSRCAGIYIYIYTHIYTHTRTHVPHMHISKHHRTKKPLVFI